MAFPLRFLRNPSVRLGLVTATGIGMIVSGLTAFGTSSTHYVDDLNWLAGEHSTATAPSLPYFDANRNLNLGSTPQGKCGPGSLPETSWQGRVPAKDYSDGRAAKGYLCNTALVSHFGQSGGYRVARYVDTHGHVCAFYDSTLLFPVNAADGDPVGTYALDMSNPKHPVRTAALQSPAMLTPHESLRLNSTRGLLVADAGSPATQAGFVDVYSVANDCRNPVFESSLPIGPFGHESGFS